MSTKKPLNGLLITVEPEKPSVTPVSIDHDFRAIQKIIDVNCFDIVRAKIGGKYFDVYCDDEGLLKSDPILSAATKDGYGLFGNLFICQNDGRGNSKSLTPEEILHITKHVFLRLTPTGAFPCLDYEY